MDCCEEMGGGVQFFASSDDISLSIPAPRPCGEPQLMLSCSPKRPCVCARAHTCVWTDLLEDLSGPRLHLKPLCRDCSQCQLAGMLISTQNLSFFWVHE